MSEGQKTQIHAILREAQPGFQPLVKQYVQEPSLPGVPDGGPRSATAATTIAFVFRVFSRNSLNARHRKISADGRHHHRVDWSSFLERVRSEMARTFARRYPDRAGQLRFLFPHRHLHYHQHRAQFDLLDFSALSSAL
jgi:hypothetical protein